MFINIVLIYGELKLFFCLNVDKGSGCEVGIG